MDLVGKFLKLFTKLKSYYLQAAMNLTIDSKECEIQSIQKNSPNSVKLSSTFNKTTAKQSSEDLKKDTVSPSQLSQALQTLSFDNNYTIVDVRSEGQFAHGSIERAVNIPLEKLQEKDSGLLKFPNERHIFLVVCQSGFRSKKSQRILSRLGYRAINLQGGIDQWKSFSFPLSKRPLSLSGKSTNSKDLDVKKNNSKSKNDSFTPTQLNRLLAKQSLKQGRLESRVEVIDVRSASEFFEAHIAGSINICLSEVEQHLKTLQNRSDIIFVVYCKNGGRSCMVAQKLESNGCSAFCLKGGLHQWQSEGFPVSQ